MSIEYAIIVRNKTRLESLVERFNTQAQARFYIERSGGDFDDYVKEHDTFYQSLEALQSHLTPVIKHKIVERQYVPSYIFAETNLIIVIGQDGLVANTAKYARGCPIIAVNPDPKRYDGILLPFDPKGAIPAVKKVLAGDYGTRIARFAEASLKDGQRLLAFNDLFIGNASHVSARYRITYGDQMEEQSSSGLIVSTPAGSSGWLSSIFNMVYGVACMFEENLHPKQPSLSDGDLVFAVREPYKSVRTQIGIVAGLLRQGQSIQLESLMPTHGVIFSDGIENDFLAFNSGTQATIGLSKQTATLVTP